MSEKSQRLFTIMSEIDDEKIREAAEPLKKAGHTAPHWRRWAVAACLCLSVGLSLYLLPNLVGCGGKSGGEGHSEASSFMSYAGPMLPMTLKEDNDSISAERELTWDFKPWVPRWRTIKEQLEREHPEPLSPEKRQELLAQYQEWFPNGGFWETDSHILVHDRYTLQNTSDQDQRISILYPYITSLEDQELYRPTLTLDGKVLTAREHIGGYTGGYTGSFNGHGMDEGSCNLDRPNSWEVYDVLLNGGEYRRDAMEPWPDFKGIPAIVYSFTDAYGPEDREAAPTPRIRVSFDLDYSKTRIQGYDFQGVSRDTESGHMDLSFSIPRSEENQSPKLLIVIGEDIRDLTWTAAIGGSASDAPLPEGTAGVTVERHETDLDDALRQVLALYREARRGSDGPAYLPELSFDLWYGAFCDMILGRDDLPRTDLERYEGAWLEMALSDAVSVDRVCYLEAELTIPAGESVTLTADFTKAPSFDYACAHTENQGVSGYDMVPELDSKLRCTSQVVRLLDHGQIQIVRQNFGFDLERNIDRVELDPGVPHYYLEVRRSPGSYDPAPPK